MEGTWSQTGNTLNLKLAKMGGSTIADLHKLVGQDKDTTDNFDKPIVLELSPDQKTLTVTQFQTGSPKTPMVFKKNN